MPDRSRHSEIRPAVDGYGHLDFGAFGTEDFERLYGKFDKARYKADRLAEDLRYSLIRRDGAMEHIPGPAKYQVLDYLNRDIIDFDHIDDLEMQEIARWDGRARRLRDEIRSLREYSWEESHKEDK